MIFYMAIRYEGGDGWPDLEPNNSTSNGTAPYIGRLSVLLAWNAVDPPDAFEMRRNDRIYDVWQHNRNPFIDHPEWANSIWN
jgi:endonuclease I